jgi:DNA-binding SARP family transcriptional activator/ABC-type branched-subunit amino acid transport system substrate-binding protein
MEFKLLGPLEVVTARGSAEIGSGKRRALLTYLLLHANEVVSAERLIDELWSDQPPATAAKSVQVYVSQLRKAFDETGEVLRTRGSGYVVKVGAGELDVDRFEQLLWGAQRALDAGDVRAAADAAREALAIWRGPALHDVAYESFAQVEAARLDELRLVARETRIDAELGLGEHRRLVGELESLVAAHPTREHFRAQLMLALYRCDRQSEALAVYRDGRTLLDQELGLEPSPELRELEQKILLQSPDLAPSRRDFAQVVRRAVPRSAVATRERRGARLLVAGALVLGAAAVLAIAASRGGSNPKKPLLGVQALACGPVAYHGTGQPQRLIVLSTALEGDLSANGVQTAEALRLLLEERGWRAGSTRIGLQACNDQTANANTPDLSRCQRNAEAIARTRSVVGVIGPLQSDCTGTTLPILSRAAGGPIPVVGASATRVGLTRKTRGVDPWEPNAYYPSGRRNFVRVVPADDIQGAAAAAYLNRLGVRRAVVVRGDFLGRILADSFSTAATRLGMRVPAALDWDPDAGDFRAVANRARRLSADAVYLAGVAQDNGPRLLTDLRAALPHGQLIGPDGMSQPELITREAGSAAEGFLSTISVIPPERLPGAGRRFVERFRRRFGEEPAFYAIYGAQAGQLLLDTIARTGPDRRRVMAQLLRAHVTGGLIGDFDIDRFGDTSLTRAGLYRIENGENRYVTSVFPPATLLDRR